MEKEVRDKLMEAAVFAPSADNTPTWKYSWISNNELKLFIETQKSNLATDNRFVLSDLAIGAVIENIFIKSGSLGFNVEIKLFPEESNKSNNLDLHYVALLVFNESSLAKDELFKLADSIETRCTDRRFPFSGPVADDVQKSTCDIIKSLNGKVVWFSTPYDIKKVLPTICFAESVRFQSETLHNELFSTINFEDENCETGMPVSTLYIEKIALPMFKLLRYWKFMKILCCFGVHYIMGLRSVWLPIKLSPSLCLVKVDNKNRENIIEAGRILQRVWLNLDKNNLSVQPYAAPGVFSLEFVNIEDNLKGKIKSIAEKMKNIVEEGYGIMFFRVGSRSDTPSYRTNRKSYKSYEIISDNESFESNS